MAFKFVPYAPGGSGGDNTVIDVTELPTENVDETKIYRMAEARFDLLILNPSDGSIISVEAKTGCTVQAYVVDSLPEIMEPIDLSTTTLLCYIIESTGVAYISVQGTSESAITFGALFGAADGGFVDSVESIVTPDTPTIYTVRENKTSYGVPNEIGDKILYEYNSQDGWTDIKKAFNIEKNSLHDEITSLQNDVTYLTSQNDTLSTEKEQLRQQLATEKEQLRQVETEKAALANRIDNFFNISYGETEPTDTSKLWVKTTEPTATFVSSVKNMEAGFVQVLSATSENATSKSDGVAVSGKIYFTDVNGYGIYCFDPQTASVTILRSSSSSIFHSCIAAVGSKIYAFAGSSIKCFDTETGLLEDVSYTCDAGSYSSNENYYMRAAAVGTKIYIFGGYSLRRGWSQTVWRFDTETNEIAGLAEAALPVNPRERIFGIAVVGTNIYMALNRTLYRFNTETETYSEALLSLQIDDYLWGDFATIGTTMYCFGERSIYAYDTTTDTATKLDLTLKYSGRYCLAVNVDDMIYLIGGGPFSDTEHNKIQAFNPSRERFSLEINTIQIIPTLESNTFRLTNEEDKSVMIGVGQVYMGDAYGEGQLVTAALYKDGEWKDLY